MGIQKACFPWCPTIVLGVLPFWCCLSSLVHTFQSLPPKPPASILPWLPVPCHRQMEYTENLSAGAGQKEGGGHVPWNWNLSDKRCDSSHGERDSWKIAANSPCLGCAWEKQAERHHNGLWKYHCSQSPLMLSQNTQPVYFLVTWLKLTLLETESVLVLIW